MITKFNGKIIEYILSAAGFFFKMSSIYKITNSCTMMTIVVNQSSINSTIFLKKKKQNNNVLILEGIMFWLYRYNIYMTGFYKKTVFYSIFFIFLNV